MRKEGERMREWENEKKWQKSMKSEWGNMLKDNLLAELSIKFGVRVVRLYKYLAFELKEPVISKQIYRSGTSIGANIAESKNAQSPADFLNKLNIALKEANETEYWLKLLLLSDYVKEEEYESLQNDLNVIIGTLVKVIKKVKDNEQL